MKYLLIVLLTLMCFSSASYANQDELNQALAIAKLTGACGVVAQMINLQNMTKLEGGDEFIDRFLKTELARLDISIEQYNKQCTDSVEAYNKLTKFE
jgi:hypothetical protein